MPLPLILAGPVLRRVEPGMVSVWIALREAADITLSLWLRGQVHSGTEPGAFSGPRADFVSAPQATVRIAENLHVVVVTLIPQNDDDEIQELPPGALCSYNVSFSNLFFAGTRDLKTEGLLRDDVIDGHLVTALGYGSGHLPAFATVPADINDVKIFHTSCRRPHERGPDAMAFLDDIIEDNLLLAESRPHLLFLTGDQIYADDVGMSLLPLITKLGQELMGSVREKIQGEFGEIEISQETLPTLFRGGFMKANAGLTSGTKSHLFGFGEYAAMYLMVWNNQLWPSPEEDGSFATTKFDDIEDILSRIEAPGDEITEELITTWRELFKLPSESSIPTTDLQSYLRHFFLTLPRSNLRHFFTASEDRFDPENLEEKRLADVDDQRFELTYNFAKTQQNIGKLEKFREFVKWLQGFLGAAETSAEKQLEHLALFYSRLAQVRRVMANVPSFMMWDDHDVTDDWNLTRAWQIEVASKAAGISVLRNGMLTGALFQLWGNDPVGFRADPAVQQLLSSIEELHPEDADAPSPSALTDINALLGLGPNESPIKWHSSYDGPLFRVLLLDTRTRRGFGGLRTPAELLTEAAINDQIPDADLPAGMEVLIVVSPVPVLGPPVDEDVARPLAARVADFLAALDNEPPRGHVTKDIEWWAVHPPTFERLLERLERYKKIVFLSGDVHHGLGAELDYWKKDEETPAKFVQFTASPANNIVPAPELIPITGNFGFAQRILRLGVPVARLRWEEFEPTPVVIPEGEFTKPSLRALLRRTPVLAPIHAWPAGTTTDRPPDSSWRMTLLSDDRPDSERPSSVQPKTLPEDFESRDSLAQYVVLLDRHMEYVRKNNYGRTFIFPNNIGMVRFNKTDTAFFVRHELYSVHPDQFPAGKPQVFTIHQTTLMPSTDSPPALLE